MISQLRASASPFTFAPAGNAAPVPPVAQPRLSRVPSANRLVSISAMLRSPSPTTTTPSPVLNTLELYQKAGWLTPKGDRVAPRPRPMAPPPPHLPTREHAHLYHRRGRDEPSEAMEHLHDFSDDDDVDDDFSALPTLARTARGWACDDDDGSNAEDAPLEIPRSMSEIYKISNRNRKRKTKKHKEPPTSTTTAPTATTTAASSSPSSSSSTTTTTGPRPPPRQRPAAAHSDDDDDQDDDQDDDDDQDLANDDDAAANHDADDILGRLKAHHHLPKQTPLEFMRDTLQWPMAVGDDATAPVPG